MTNHGFPFVGVVLINLIIGSATAALVESDVYLAGEHYSEWQFQGSKAKCELKHEIPQFGISRFLRLAGEELTFQIKSFQKIPISSEGLIREISPTWKHEKPDPLTSPVNIKQGLMPVVLNRKKASWLISSLAKGQMPSFDFLDWDDPRKKVQVRLSPVNYLKPYREFKRCLKQISDKGYKDYRELEVHFELDIHVLNVNEQDKLKQLAEFVVADQSIRRVSVDGHADDQGARVYNERLSKRRANSVEEYLKNAGVEPSQLRIQAYGERRPKINSRAESARAENRRAEIRLTR
ncbi:MAG: OmpA family protein [Pseudomonadota bacterium]